MNCKYIGTRSVSDIVNNIDVTHYQEDRIQGLLVLIVGQCTNHGNLSDPEEPIFQINMVAIECQSQEDNLLTNCDCFKVGLIGNTELVYKEITYLVNNVIKCRLNSDPLSNIIWV